VHRNASGTAKFASGKKFQRNSHRAWLSRASVFANITSLAILLIFHRIENFLMGAFVIDAHAHELLLITIFDPMENFTKEPTPLFVPRNFLILSSD
jgi:hypothetical protein